MTQPYETREYDLGILIILIVLCWPAALIYYFTRPTVIRYQSAPQQYNQPTQNYRPYRYCTQCGTALPENVRFCPKCGKEQTP